MSQSSSLLPTLSPTAQQQHYYFQLFAFIRNKWLQTRQEKRKFYIMFFIWFISLLWCERFLFTFMIRSCSFDTSLLTSESTSSILGYESIPASSSFTVPNRAGIQITRMVLIGDPQLTDAMSYGYAPRGSWLLSIIQFYSDIYMRKSFQRLLTRLEPDGVAFLGDLFDGARVLTSEEYQAEANRFFWVFDTVVSTRMLFIAGNHDIGYRVNGLQKTLIERFKRTFGPLNYVTKIGGVNFIGISSLTLDSVQEGNDAEAVSETLDFVNSINATAIYPSILLSHVPLWRPEDSNCGWYRSKTPITDRIGVSYTNMLPNSISQMLLQKIKPFHVFSGDDHDHCQFTHTEAAITEDTIPTFSWMQGMSVPGFGVVTIKTEPNTSPQLSLEICPLPSQLRIYLYYLFLFCFSVFYLVPFNCSKRNSSKANWIKFRKRAINFVASLGVFYLILLWIET